MNKQNTEFSKLIHEFELEIRDKTIREFAEEFEKLCIVGGIYPAFIKSTLNKLVDKKLNNNNNIKEKDINASLENSCEVCIHKDICIFNFDNTPCKKFLNENILK